ncbi:FAD-dependent oxidoreductase [Peribacillus tepidiphilus]|uniref:FAD-dependent oxidoreductase n=1 Tax=Peribacillus tepidiphilus TaxID=2652445 RepID=UPI00129240C1|nr:FAD/NAD(P)-binding oxidoreductase [Peribacillus tepidiphilus]
MNKHVNKCWDVVIIGGGLSGLVAANDLGEQNLKVLVIEKGKTLGGLARTDVTSANPNWSKKELTDLLYMHLKLTTDEVVARIHKDWDADIRAFDVGENHIIKMADALTAGIVKQFPKKFE